MIPCSPPNHEPHFEVIDASALKSLLSTSSGASSMMQSAMVFYALRGSITLDIDQQTQVVHPHPQSDD